MSYITVSAEKVIKCCENYFIKMENNKAHDAANIIRKYAEKKTYIFFGKPWGYQNAYEYLESGKDFETLHYAACFWKGEYYEKIERLYTLAKHGDPVMVSDDVAFILTY